MLHKTRKKKELGPRGAIVPRRWQASEDAVKAAGVGAVAGGAGGVGHAEAGATHRREWQGSATDSCDWSTLYD